MNNPLVLSVNIGMDKDPIKYPSQILAEEEAAAAASTTASVANTDLPLGKKKPKVMRRRGLVAVSDIPTDTLGEKRLGEGEGKPRHCLPQITDWDGFVKAVEEAGGKIEDDLIDPGMLEPTQSNFNQEKVDRIVASGKIDKPVVVSSDAFILDGHHRWLAAKELDVRLPVRVVSLTIDQLHELCDGAPFVEKKKLDESTHS